MKRIAIIGVCVLVLTGMICGCANTNREKEIDVVTQQEESSNTNYDEEKEIVNVSVNEEGNISWKQFLKDYEAWVDEYVSFMKKYKDDPTNVSLISDYAKFVEQTAEWAIKSEEYQSGLEDTSPEMLGEYVETLGRITRKLMEIAY